MLLTETAESLAELFLAPLRGSPAPRDSEGARVRQSRELAADSSRRWTASQAWHVVVRLFEQRNEPKTLPVIEADLLAGHETLRKLIKLGVIGLHSPSELTLIPRCAHILKV